MAKRSVKRKPQERWDWSEFADVHEKSPEERLERAIARYRREKLLRSQSVQPRDADATITPFPSEQEQAAGKPAAPSSDS